MARLNGSRQVAGLAQMQWALGGLWKHIRTPAVGVLAYLGLATAGYAMIITPMQVVASGWPGVYELVVSAVSVSSGYISVEVSPALPSHCLRHYFCLPMLFQGCHVYPCVLDATCTTVHTWLCFMLQWCPIQPLCHLPACLPTFLVCACPTSCHRSHLCGSQCCCCPVQPASSWTPHVSHRVPQPGPPAR